MEEKESLETGLTKLVLLIIKEMPNDHAQEAIGILAGMTRYITEIEQKLDEGIH